MNYLIMLIVSIIWGYFADLRKGQVKWFMGRIVFGMFIAFVLDVIRN